jgi:CheY-like chemotaxis protein
MLNILIVDDQEHKSNQIKTILEDELNETDSNIDIAEDVKKAKRLLKKHQYDLLILDLFLPTEKGNVEDMPSAKKGINLLEAINNNDNLKQPFYIFGLTQYSNEAVEARKIFSKNMWYLIDYDATSDDWSDKLVAYIHHLIKVRKRFLEKYKSDLRFHSLTPFELIKQVLNEFGNTVKKLKVRRAGHAAFKIDDEYDVQDLVYVMLKGVMPTLLKEEEPTPKVAGKFNRIDFSDDLGTFVEIKMIGEKETEKKFIEQLKIDIQSYYKYANLTNIIFFIYDPHNKTSDVHNFYELNGEKVINGVRIMVEIIVSS